MILSHKHYIEAETLILVTKTVTNLQDFVLHPEKHLVSITQDSRQAASLWRERMKRNPYGSDGLIRLSVNGHNVFTPKQWGDVEGIWQQLVILCLDYVKNNKARVFIAEQNLEITIRKTGHDSLLFSVGNDRTVVDIERFITELLSYAEEFFVWVDQCVGLGRGEIIQQIHIAQKAFKS